MYAIIPLVVYFPIWLAFDAIGHPWTGMAGGAAMTVFGWALMWRMEFGTWRFWKK